LGSFVAFFEDISLDDVGATGGKGANLGHLAAAGYPVPPGFCVLASAYESFIAENDLEPRLLEMISSLYLEDLDVIETRLGKVRELIESAPIPAGVEADIRAAYRLLVDGSGGPETKALVAVRSSVGTRDLSATSFPGQMDTYHNVLGEDEVLRMVRKCWASAFSYRATVSRHTRGIDHFDVFVAPVVQLMVQSDAAGVIDTANPLNNRRDQMVLNACFGLGEGVVSGEVSGDHYVLDHGTLEVIQAEIGNKSLKYVLDEQSGSGIRKVPIGTEEARGPCLSAEQVRQVAMAARDIERYYGRPLDIEWAYNDAKLYILQARPITTLGAPTVGKAPVSGADLAEEWFFEFDSTVDPRYPYYTLSNISEVLPGVLTPLSISGIRPLDQAFVKNNTDLGLMKGIEPESEYTFLGIFFGRAHINLSVIQAITSKLPFTGSQEFDRMLTEDDERRPSYRFRPTPGALLTLLGSSLRSTYRTRRTPRDAAAMEPLVEERIEHGRRHDFETMPYERYAEWIHICDDLRLPLYTLHVSASQFSVVYHDLLKRLTEKWLDDASGALASRLVTGLQTLESARPSEGIWDLSRLVKESPEVTGIFETHEPGGVLAALEAAGTEDAEAFLAALREFLAEYGYRSVFEAEMMLPNWETDPSYVLAMIRNYLGADEASNPRTQEKNQETEREKAMEDALGRLSASRRRIFRYVLGQAQKFITLREFMKALLVKELAQTKKEIMVMSSRFAEDGFIREPIDFYFLTMDEVEAFARGEGADIPVNDLVPRRKREYERNQKVVLPEYSDGRPRPLSVRELESRGDVEVMEGIPVSPGKVTGRARVITDPRRHAEILPGEILVAPVTDAAWTPLFVTAVAIVVDVGGPLSHGSIVAREFGIPGVLSVGMATRIIKNGQIITVDGDEGKVYLHPSAPTG
jgi:pyruvate,water dikinase